MHIFQMKKRMQKTMESTRFAGCPIIPVAAKPGGPEVSTLDTKLTYYIHPTQFVSSSIPGVLLSKRRLLYKYSVLGSYRGEDDGIKSKHRNKMKTKLNIFGTSEYRYTLMLSPQ
jgi:hypothetical protein